MSGVEDELNEEELEALVRAAVLDAVENREEPPRGSVSDIVVFGVGAKLAIKRSVMSTVRELIGKQAFLSGPLKDAAAKTADLSSQAEALWETLKTVQKSLEEEYGPAEPVPVEPAAESKSHVNGTTDTHRHAEPVATEPELATPNVPANVPDVAHVESAAQEPGQTQKKPRRQKAPNEGKFELTDIVVNGIQVAFHEKASQEFRSFFRAFVAEITKGPVRPSWAIRLAKEHGWNVVRGTVVAQIESYIGDLSKWKDEKGEAWWTLPSHDGPAGTERRTR